MVPVAKLTNTLPVKKDKALVLIHGWRLRIARFSPVRFSCKPLVRFGRKERKVMHVLAVCLLPGFAKMGPLHVILVDVAEWLWTLRFYLGGP